MTTLMTEEIVRKLSEVLINEGDGTVYLLHFDEPYKHARHYMGWASKLEERLAEHEAGTGANLLKYVKAAGIGWTLVRIWENRNRYEERRLKNMGGLARVCPVCQAEAKR